MRLYKVSARDVETGHVGYFYATNKKAADDYVRNYRKTVGDKTDFSAAIEPIEVNPSRDGICAALNKHGAHADNG